ncbi:tol [Fusarium circinatum]|uniref:Tol n=1 Tax=Fusarium circinatum TaxID=48490 RepID=A0A8H5XA73_FUSCI|nr:tol [Fusarium circinatum]
MNPTNFAIWRIYGEDAWYLTKVGPDLNALKGLGPGRQKWIYGLPIRRVTICLTEVLIAAAAVSAVALPDGVQAVDNPLKGYKVVPMEWTGSSEEGANPVTLTGTAEEVVSQIQKLNPDYVFPDNTTEPEMEKRSQGHIICKVGRFGAMDVRAAHRERDYLRSLGNNVCHVGAGPRTCTKIACATGDAIILCNDNGHAISPRCSYLADYIDHIIRACSWTVNSPPCTTRPCGPSWSVDMVRGQQFDSDNYNVIVAKDTC